VTRGVLYYLCFVIKNIATSQTVSLLRAKFSWDAVAVMLTRTEISLFIPDIALHFVHRYKSSKYLLSLLIYDIIISNNLIPL
jgi:hypothetical protein